MEKKKRKPYLVYRCILPQDSVSCTNVTSSGEPHTFFCHRYHNCSNSMKPTRISNKTRVKGKGKAPRFMNSTSITNGAEIFANPCKFCRWHSHKGFIFCFWYPKMFTINVHELHLKISNLILSFKKLRPGRHASRVDLNNIIINLPQLLAKEGTKSFFQLETSYTDRIVIRK